MIQWVWNFVEFQVQYIPRYMPSFIVNTINFHTFWQNMSITNALIHNNLYISTRTFLWLDCHVFSKSTKIFEWNFETRYATLCIIHLGLCKIWESLDHRKTPCVAMISSPLRKKGVTNLMEFWIENWTKNVQIAGSSWVTFLCNTKFAAHSSFQNLNHHPLSLDTELTRSGVSHLKLSFNLGAFVPAELPTKAAWWG
jgi:hypothetical protein